jgi:hypothetical protein
MVINVMFFSFFAVSQCLSTQLYSFFSVTVTVSKREKAFPYLTRLFGYHQSNTMRRTKVKFYGFLQVFSVFCETRSEREC